mgnify:CR=1 FL=1|tara:strand:+ start:6448 stop:6555 length:108 start_codon:yes stop_codon:yes gene_type:complete
MTAEETAEFEAVFDQCLRDMIDALEAMPDGEADDE